MVLWDAMPMVRYVPTFLRNLEGQFNRKSPVFWDIRQCSPLKINYVSEERIASIFRVEE
jgi:hypothetical protein